MFLLFLIGLLYYITTFFSTNFVHVFVVFLANLYKATIKYLEETGFKILKQTEDLHKEPIWENNIETEHEKMFSEQGIKIKALIAKLK